MINETTKYIWIKKVIEFLENPKALKLEINFENKPFMVTYLREEPDKIGEENVL